MGRGARACYDGDRRATLNIEDGSLRDPLRYEEEPFGLRTYAELRSNSAYVASAKLMRRAEGPAPTRDGKVAETTTRLRVYDQAPSLRPGYRNYGQEPCDGLFCRAEGPEII